MKTHASSFSEDLLVVVVVVIDQDEDEDAGESICSLPTGKTNECAERETRARSSMYREKTSLTSLGKEFAQTTIVKAKRKKNDERNLFGAVLLMYSVVEKYRRDRTSRFIDNDQG